MPRLTKKQRTTRAARKARHPECIPTTFQPLFLEQADQRLKSIKFIKRELKVLERDAGVDSKQKELVAKRAVFLAVRLETMEADCVEGRKIDQTLYNATVNALTRCLSLLGLEKTKKTLWQNDPGEDEEDEDDDDDD